jgi:hypothetical protein
MTKPRIYLYKITFEEVPYFYYGIHSEKKYDEYYMGSPIKNKWVWKTYTPKKQILQEFNSWEQAAVIEERIIKHFMGKDPNCLNACAGRAFLNGRGKDNHVYGMKWWNNGTKNQRSTNCPGEEWKRGKLQNSTGYKRGKNNHNFGKKWWNNGNDEIFAKEAPYGWVKGRIRYEYLSEKRKPLTEEHKQKISLALQRRGTLT